MKRFFEYLAILIVAAIVFVASSGLWSGLVAALLAAAVAAALALGLWWFLIRRSGNAGAKLDKPLLGIIPDHEGAGPAPAISAAVTPEPYAAIANELAALSETQVLLVTSPNPGQGATTTAVNVAAAASRAGRRVLLIDADPIGRRLSSFNGSGSTPGLFELARGTAGLEEAARMWNLGPNTRMPMIPVGEPEGDTSLATPHLAGVIDRVAERADLVLIDAPSASFDGIPADLAAHADGSILVLPPSGSSNAAQEAANALAEIGAPVVGYVVNRGRPAAAPTGWRMFRRFTATVVLLMAGYAAWTGLSIWTKWLSVERVAIDTQAARIDLAGAAPATASEPDGAIDNADLGPDVIGSTSQTGPIDTFTFETFLILGTDSRSPDTVSGRADVIILVLVPADGSTPGMVSLPRDLFLPNACTSGSTRINAGLNGCGSVASGMELMSINVEDFTGIEVDHVALFDFEGFEDIIDAVGGIEICATNPIRGGRADLELSLPAGCAVYDGETTLKWVRSRKTQELVDGSWRSIPGVNDLARNQRQQDVIVQMFSKMQSMRDPGDLASVVGDLSDAFTLGNSMGIGEAITLAWSMRDIGNAGFSRFKIPVTGHVTTTGAQVLLPTEPFPVVISEYYPDYQASAG